ncbi:sulfotransferase 1C4-like [Tubulanus polymorphus]|uniref:sulfotransferase 1C4-like n=1 Tax=Tubulanus polymorphus TaxID=672921 RepID=UPI003DA554D4
MASEVPIAKSCPKCDLPDPLKRNKSVDVSSYELPGAYTYEGVPLAYFTKVEHIEKIRNLHLREDDVIVASYPKTGTTLTQEITWLIRNNADTEAASKSYNYVRVPYLENCFPPESDGILLLEQLTPPRHLKTHLPWHLCPQKSIIDGKHTKAIYVMRNPKDALVSYYYFYCSCASFGQFPGTWSDFFELFLMDKLCYGNILDHYVGWWAMRDNPNILLLKYEDILKDHAGQIRHIGKFLGYDLSDDTVETIRNFTTFKKMSKNPMTNYTSIPEDIDTSIVPFMRKGQVGDWKNHFTVAQNELMDMIINKKLAGTGLTFEYDSTNN